MHVTLQEEEKKVKTEAKEEDKWQRVRKREEERQYKELTGPSL